MDKETEVTAKTVITPRKVRIVIHSGQDLWEDMLYLRKEESGSNQMINILNLPVSLPTHTTQSITYTSGLYISLKHRSLKCVKEDRP